MAEYTSGLRDWLSRNSFKELQKDLQFYCRKYSDCLVWSTRVSVHETEGHATVDQYHPICPKVTLTKSKNMYHKPHFSFNKLCFISLLNFHLKFSNRVLYINEFVALVCLADKILGPVNNYSRLKFVFLLLIIFA